MFISCYSQKDKVDCYQGYLGKFKKAQEYGEIRSSLNDSLNHWINKRIAPVSVDLKGRLWKVDSNVFFNKQKNKALLMILIKNSASKEFDEVKIVSAEDSEEGWKFYYLSLPMISIYRGSGKEGMLSFSQLSERGTKEIINDGYIDRKCNISDEYIESDLWFADWIKEKHNRFLKWKLPE